jgi:hypothetical protein
LSATDNRTDQASKQIRAWRKSGSDGGSGGRTDARSWFPAWGLGCPSVSPTSVSGRGQSPGSHSDPCAKHPSSGLASLASLLCPSPQQSWTYIKRLSRDHSASCAFAANSRCTSVYVRMMQLTLYMFLTRTLLVLKSRLASWNRASHGGVCATSAFLIARTVPPWAKRTQFASPCAMITPQGTPTAPPSERAGLEFREEQRARTELNSIAWSVNRAVTRTFAS